MTGKGGRSAPAGRVVARTYGYRLGASLPMRV